MVFKLIIYQLYVYIYQIIYNFGIFFCSNFDFLKNFWLFCCYNYICGYVYYVCCYGNYVVCCYSDFCYIDVYFYSVCFVYGVCNCF